MKIYSMQHHSLLSRLSINAHVCLFLSSLIMSERLLCTSCFFPLSLPSLFFFFISVSPFLSMPHLSCSLSPFSPLFSLSSMLKPLLAFFRASYSRHSWDSSWTTERRQTVLLLGCQSFSLLSLLLASAVNFGVRFLSPWIGHYSGISHSLLCAMPCSLCVCLAGGCVSSQTGNSSCDLEKTKTLTRPC